MDTSAARFEKAIGLAKAVAEARTGESPVPDSIARAIMEIPLADFKPLAAAMARVFETPPPGETASALVPGWVPQGLPDDWCADASMVSELLLGTAAPVFEEAREEAMEQLVPDEFHSTAAAWMSGSTGGSPALDTAMGLAAELAEAAGISCDPMTLARLVATGILPEFEAAQDDMQRSLQSEREAIPGWRLAAQIMGGRTDTARDALGTAATIAKREGLVRGEAVAAPKTVAPSRPAALAPRR